MALEDRPRGCPETSVRNYRYTLRNNPEERSSHILRGWSLKSCIFNISSHFPTLNTNGLTASVTVVYVTYAANTNLCHSVHMYWTVLLIVQYVCTERYFLSFNMYVLNGTSYRSICMYWTVLLIIQYVCTEPKGRFTAISSLSSPSLAYLKDMLVLFRNIGIYQNTVSHTHTHTHTHTKQSYWPPDKFRTSIVFRECFCFFVENK
jgi:hypothetical protein